MSETFVGSPAGTVYGNYAAGVIYVDSQLGDAYRAWETLTAPDRKRAMLSATAYIDRQSWIEAYDTFAERDVLAAFVTASYELAALVASDPDVVAALDQGSNIARVYAGGAGVDFHFPTSPKSGTAPTLPPVIESLLGRYLLSATGSGPQGGSGVSGDCHNPASDCCDFDRTEPY